MRDQDLLRPLDLLMKTMGAMEAIEETESKFGRLIYFFGMSIKRLSKGLKRINRERFLKLHSRTGGSSYYLRLISGTQSCMLRTEHALVPFQLQCLRRQMSRERWFKAQGSRNPEKDRFTRAH